MKTARAARSLILFLLAFGLFQGGAFLLNSNPTFGWILSLISFGIVLVVVFFTKAEGARFKEYGYLTPRRTKRLLTISLFFAVLYFLVVLFVPGGASGFEASPGVPLSLDLFFIGGSILLAAIAAEMVFRGYIHTNLCNSYGFYPAVIIVSIMFMLFATPITVYFASDWTGILNSALPLLAESVFLSFLFKETKTLLCPIAFAATVTMLDTFTPLEAIAVEYKTPLMVLTYFIFIPFMQAFIGEIRAQDYDMEVTPVFENE